MGKKSSRMILILTFGVFGILNTEMGIVGILPMIAEQFQVNIATAGWLVSAFALVVAIAGPTMPLICSKMNRKTLMLISGGIFIITNIISAFASNFAVLMLARIVPAAFHPAYVSMALTEAGKAVKPEESAKAVAKVFIGVSAGMVLGVPVTNLIAASSSFTIAMLFFAAVNMIAFVLTIFFIPSLPATETVSYGKQLGVLKKPSMLLSIVIVVFLNGAIFGFYSYISDFFGTITRIDASAISLFLMFYGVANIVGNMIAGKILTVNAKLSTFVLPFALAAAYIGLFLMGRMTVATAICIVVIGALAGINSNVNQYLITEAGPEAPEFSNGLYLTSANLGTTFGTFVCGLFITAIDTRYALIGTFIFVAVGFSAILLKMGMERSRTTTANEGGRN
ncbi:Predicted arabinose efflux permease, MFS family [Eubacterium maltosivorans]|uniref:MFS transporter n=1 Tax=Eubacterium maltosivorans TaxID=2041044 RepID=UPI00087EBDE2|nr:MFS transporter [Eubacterium maltosivorans]WPK82418.1 Inner membrane transport protein YdhP [Eubacterium maltosivorans]SDO48171.1 Predicted arabinose efflux permease, MFS family [Eubacterium maltosivorans]